MARTPESRAAHRLEVDGVAELTRADHANHVLEAAIPAGTLQRPRQLLTEVPKQEREQGDEGRERVGRKEARKEGYEELEERTAWTSRIFLVASAISWHLAPKMKMFSSPTFSCTPSIRALASGNAQQGLRHNRATNLDLDVGAVVGANDDAAVHHELHVRCARGLSSRGGDVLRDVVGGDDDLRVADLKDTRVRKGHTTSARTHKHGSQQRPDDK